MLDQIDQIDSEMSTIEERLLILVREHRQMQEMEKSGELEDDIMDEDDKVEESAQEESDMSTVLPHSKDRISESSSDDENDESPHEEEFVWPKITQNVWKPVDFARLNENILAKNRSIVTQAKKGFEKIVENPYHVMEPSYLSPQDVLEKYPNLLDKEHLRPNLVSYISRKKKERMEKVIENISVYKKLWVEWRQNILDNETTWVIHNFMLFSKQN